METTSLAGAAVAREVNSQICEAAKSLAAKGDERHEYVFFCECGCLLPVRLTLEAFLNTQCVLSEGHRPRRDDETATDERSRPSGVEPTEEAALSAEPLPSI